MRGFGAGASGSAGVTGDTAAGAFRGEASDSPAGRSEHAASAQTIAMAMAIGQRAVRPPREYMSVLIIDASPGAIDSWLREGELGDGERANWGTGELEDWRTGNWKLGIGSWEP